VKHGGIDEVRVDLRWVCLRQNVGGDAFVLAYFESREPPPPPSCKKILHFRRCATR
jgi:hypothetical protein